MIKKINILIFLLVAVLILISCDDTFSPYTKFETDYSFNLIVIPDTNLQVATLFKSYPLNENDPRNSSFIHNAFIRLWRGNDEVHILQDSTITYIDSSGSNIPISIYYTKKFQPNPGDILEIEALLPDGNRLKSRTRVPNFVKRDLKRSTATIPSGTEEIVSFTWFPNTDRQLFIPTLKLIYKQKVGEINILKSVKIPWNYIIEDGKEIGIDRPPSRIPTVNYSLANIEKVLNSFSGDENKNNFIILSAILELKILDNNLSMDYLVSSRLFEGFSIILDSQDFTNIKGGFGIFGSYIVQKMAIRFDKIYLSGFGFTN